MVTENKNQSSLRKYWWVIALVGVVALIGTTIGILHARGVFGGEKEEHTTAPLQMRNWDVQWQTGMSKQADKYYQVKYKLEPWRAKSNKKYHVARPNHGTLHGIRQGLFAVDIGYIMEKHYPQLPVGQFITAERKRVGDQIDKKIFFAAMFQRVGRESEGANTLDYVKSSKAKFEKEAAKLIPAVYDNTQEVRDYGDAQLLTLDQVQSNHPGLVAAMSAKARIIGDIIHSGHKFDLRRIMGFKPAMIQQAISKRLSLGPNDEHLVPVLWDLSGRYLKVTDDHDLVLQEYRRGEIFFKLSNNLDLANRLISNERARFWNQHQ